LFTPAPKPGDWPTVGPSGDEHPPVATLAVVNAQAGNAGASPVWAPSPAWDSGWWAYARPEHAHAGRIGRTIIPRAIVVHTTDTMPGGFASIVKSWTSKPGGGNAAHFMIGRTAEDGVVQFAPITKNTNHAGGARHGWFKSAGYLVHPNTCTVGIELDSGGSLRKRSDGTWYQPDTNRSVADSDVYVDTRGRGWHVVTPYQRETLKKLCDDLQACLTPFGEGTTIVPTGSYKENAVLWADSGGYLYPRNCVGHVTLDPVRKTDPGPQVIGWLG
jgi:hypothetical protein